MTSVDVRNMTRRAAPRFPYGDIASAALPRFDLSLVYTTEANARAMNKTLRGKSYVPNVLSYESGKRSGEIAICLAEAKRQAPLYGMSYRDFVAYLFIHGCLHLIGQAHGPTMENKERALMARFITVSPYPSYNGPTNRHRHRHRDSSDENSRRRGGVRRKRR